MTREQCVGRGDIAQVVLAQHGFIARAGLDVPTEVEGEANVPESRNLERTCAILLLAAPQPCTKSTPGTNMAGATRVPKIRSPSTSMATMSSCVVIGFGDDEFGQESDMRVDAAE